MPEKKKSSPLSKFIFFLVGLVAFAAIGVVLAVYMETNEFNITIDIIKEVKDSENFYLYVGGACAVYLFILFIKWTNVNSATPRQMIDKNYDVNSDKKGSARWLTDKEINTYFPRCAYDEVGKYKVNGFVVQTIDSGARTFAN